MHASCPSGARLLLAGIGLALAVTSFAVTPCTLPGTELRELPMSANGQRYLLYVGLPPSFGTDPLRHYPTLYFVDGYWDFPVMYATTGNLRVDNAAPEMLVVGIGYAGANPDYSTLRAIDLTPGIDVGYDRTGTRSSRAEDFLNVLAQEIIPFIENEYRADPGYRVLAGNSFGGLFTTYVALTRPQLFQGYIASSPSLWWRNQYLNALEADFARTHRSLPIRLYFGFASGDDTSITDSTRAMVRQLQSHNYGGLALALREMDGERHSSTKPEAFTRGIRFAFAPIAQLPALGGTTMHSSLINISTRGLVGTGDSVLIAGFVVDGMEAKRVLIRGLGPSLAAYNVSNVLADPRVQLYNSASTVIAENDNWNNNDIVLRAAFYQAGAFPLPDGSRDSAFIATLAPGNYTAIVSGADGATGNGAVEVYELP